MTELVDTHCHIQSAGNSAGERTTGEIWAKDPDLTGDLVVKNAVEAGVSKLLCVGCDLEDSKLAIDFVQNHANVWASIGIHPHEAQHYLNEPTKLMEFNMLIERQKVVAVGECGLDYFYEHSQREAQIVLLRHQIELALEYQLYKGIRGVLHSYTDSMENLQKAQDRGLYIGVNGIATFAKNVSQLDVYRAIPLSKLLLETDAPFLTPTPYRGTINESKRVGTIAEFLANLRGESLEQLALETTSNAHDLFGI
jgi:TatD DNase family protein